MIKDFDELRKRGVAAKYTGIVAQINHMAFFSTFQDHAMRYWRDQGVPAEKLNLGFAAYGRTFTLSSQSSEVGASIRGAGNAGRYTKEAGFWSYYEVKLQAVICLKSIM